MGDLSKYFSRHEIACKCGCGFDTMDAETLRLADEVRELAGHSITPTSGCRCPRHNRRVGGGRKSQHLYARAMDLPLKAPKAIYDYLCVRYPDRYGFGLYVAEGFIHIDTKSGKPRRWGS